MVRCIRFSGRIRAEGVTEYYSYTTTVHDTVVCYSEAAYGDVEVGDNEIIVYDGGTVFYVNGDKLVIITVVEEYAKKIEIPVNILLSLLHEHIRRRYSYTLYGR